jgi:hypothetical protein
MNPNEIQITNVFVRRAGELAPDDTLPWGGPNDMVVQWTAGASANNNPAVDISISVAIWDQFAGALVGPPVALPLRAPDGDAEERTYEAVWTPLPILLPPPPPYRSYQAIAWLVRPFGVPPITNASVYKGALFVAY